MPKLLPFSDWRPDLAPLGNPATEAKNCLPGEDGFRPLPSMQVQSNALTYYCRGAYAAKAKDGTSYNFTGDGKNIWVMSDNSWSEVNGNGGGADAYTLGADESWEFVKWGEKVIAVAGANGTDPVPQIADLDGTDFGDLAGTPPRARHISVVRNFVVLGNLYEGGVAYPDRIRWCGINDETNWTVDRSAQADYQPLKGNGGDINAIRGGEYGVIWQGNSTWVMRYTGPPEIFQLDEIPGIGTPAPNSVVQKGDVNFFYSDDGFYAMAGGNQPEAVGRHILDRYVQKDFDLNHSHRMVGAEDKNRQVIWWIYPGVGHADGVPNRVVMFDWRTGKWTHADIETEWVYDSLGTSTSLDALPAAGYTDLDAMTIGLDSSIWKGGAVTFGIFDNLHRQNQLSGAAMSAVFATIEKSFGYGRRSLVGRARPVVDGSAATMRVGTRDDQEDAVGWSATLTEEEDGSVATRSDARYHRFEVTTLGDYTRALGVLPEEVVDAGAR